MTRSRAIDAISAIQPDLIRDVVHIECAGGDETTHLDLRSGALGNLILGLRQAAKAFPGSGDFEGQPLILTGTGLIAIEDGTLALELVLDGTLRVVIEIPEAGMPALQECLFAIEAIRDPDPTGMTAH